jgi:hypothetical protein
MRSCCYLCSVFVIAGLMAGCSPSIREKHVYRAPVTVSWEFNNIEKDGETFTDAVLIIQGVRPQRHALGIFPGKIHVILKTEVPRKEMEGGTLSGFITEHRGGEEEVLVRYNEHLNKLIIVTRQSVAASVPGSYKTLMVIPLQKPHTPDTGF